MCRKPRAGLEETEAVRQFCRRNSAGVIPVDLRNVAIKWLASVKPVRCATACISVLGSVISSSLALLMRKEIRYSTVEQFMYFRKRRDRYWGVIKTRLLKTCRSQRVGIFFFNFFYHGSDIILVERVVREPVGVRTTANSRRSR